MTEDPVRLLSDDGADSLERELLESVRDVTPKSHQKQAVWMALATQVAAVSVVGAAQASGGAALKGSLASLLPKTLAAKALLGVAAGGALLGASVVYLREAEPPPAPVPVTAPRSLEAPRTPPQEPEEPSPAREVEPCENEQCIPMFMGAELPPRRGATPSNDRLAEESILMMDARAKLRSGNLSEAQAALEHLQRKFPRGMLSQEREVLFIELLSARGNDAAARRKARAFMAAHPKSPHSQRLSRFLEAP